MRKNWPFLLSCVLIVSILLSEMTGAMAAKSKKSANPETKLIAFTFDDGPGDYTEMLLDGLEERGAVATFFMTGENGTWGVKKYGKVMERMIELNCQMANHTYNHKKFSKLTHIFSNRKNCFVTDTHVVVLSDFFVINNSITNSISHLTGFN